MKNLLKKALSLALALVMVLGMMPVFELEAQAITKTVDYDKSADVVLTFESLWTTSLEEIDDGGELIINLKDDVTIWNRLVLDDKKVTINMNGHTIKRNHSASGAVDDGQVFRLKGSAQLRVNGGYITGGRNDGDGGAVYMDDNTLLALNGVTVYGNSCKGDGGAIYAIDDSRVYLHGNTVIGDAANVSGNLSAWDNETGAAIYCDDDSSLIIDGATITGNQAVYGEVGGIYWGSNGKCELVNVTITNNTSHEVCGGVYVPAGWYDTDIYLGGVVVIHDNRQHGGNNSSWGSASNLYLLNDDANIMNYPQNRLAAGSNIGITLGDIDEDTNDLITAGDSDFDEAQLGFFYYDHGDINGNIIRKVDQGSGNGANRWAMFVTAPGSSANQIPAITAAAVKSAYSAGVAAEIDSATRTVTLTVKNDLVTKLFLTNAPLKDFVSFSYAEAGSRLLAGPIGNDESQPDIDTVNKNFIANPTLPVSVKTPNGTFEYWTIKVRPVGEWDAERAVAKVNETEYTSFDAAWKAAIDAAKTGTANFVLLADWLAGDNNNNGIIDPYETAGFFPEAEGYYQLRSLYVNVGGSLTIDLNGHKIDRMLTNKSSLGNGRVLTVEGGSVTITDSSVGGNITGGNCAGPGGAILVNGGVVTVTGNTTISGNKATWGGAIYVGRNGSVNIDDATITGNSAEEGGAVYVYLSPAKVVMTGGTISGNKAISGNASGGAVYLSASGTLEMSGGVITGNSATNGGGIYNSSDSNSTGTLTLTGNAAITNNSATNGGGIYNGGGNAYFNSEDVTVTGNTATYGGGIYNNGGTASLTDVKVNGNTATSGGGIYIAGGSVDLNGNDVTVSGNKATGTILGGAGVYVKSGTLNVYGGSIDLNTTSGHGGGVAVLDTGAINMTGGTIASNSAGQGGGVYFNSTGTATLTGGSITGNRNGFWIARADTGKITLGGTINITGNANYNLYLYNKTVDLYHSAATPLTDGAEIGVYLGEGEYGEDNEDRISAADGNFAEKSYQYFYSDNPNYRVANRIKDSSYNLHLVKIGTAADERPIITEADVAEQYRYGSGYIVKPEQNLIYLYVTNDEYGANKTALSNMSITELAAFSFAIPGTQIANGTVKYDITENPTVVYTVVTPNGTYDYWTIDVIVDSPWSEEAVIATVTYTDGEGVKQTQEFRAGTRTDANPFKGFDTAWAFAQLHPGSTLKLFANWNAGDENSNGIIDTTEYTKNFAGAGTAFGCLAIGEEAFSSVKALSGVLNVTGAADMTAADVDVTIDLNGYTIDRRNPSAGIGSVFQLAAGKLTITDSSASKAGKITGGNSGAISVYGTAALTINGGSITDNCSGGKGGAIFASASADVTINGGTISSNEAPDGGALVIADGAELTMNGGTISGNAASTGSGGAVYIGENAKFTMNGGTITGNTAAVDGAGVYVFKGTFDFYGGSISNNTAEKSGGGVFVFTSGTMHTNGGTISGNTAGERGGGIMFSQDPGNSNIGSQAQNTAIVNNTAALGGGVAFYGCKASNIFLQNVTIGNNTAAQSGGGIHIEVDDDANIRVHGGSISDNTAPNGAGIYNENGIPSLQDTVITGNIATGTGDLIGAGVFMNDDDIYLGGSLVINENFVARGSGNLPSNLYLSDTSCDILNGVVLADGAYIGVTVYAGDYGKSDCLSADDSDFRIADAYYFHADKFWSSRDYAISQIDNGEGTADNRFEIWIVDMKSSGENPNPVIESVTAARDNFKAIGGAEFADIDVENRTVTITVNNTYKEIFSAMALPTLADVAVSDDFNILGLDEVHNFVANPSKVYQILEENNAGADGYNGWYSLWTVTVVPEGGSWSGEQGNVASVITNGGTEFFYDMEMAYLYALEHATYPGGATLKLNQNWLPNDGEDFDYSEGTDSGRLYLDDSRYNLTIDLNGYSINRNLLGNHIDLVDDGQVICIESGTLTIKDSSAGRNGKITGAYNDGKGGAIHMTGGNLILESGSICGNRAQKGAAVYVEYSAKFTMNGGKIFNCQTTGNGGAIFLDDTAVFTMNGGEIYDNRSNGGNGGGVYMEDNSIFTLNGGKIDKNYAAANGGGIYASKDGGGVTLTITGGTISNNSGVNGGGIYWVSDDAKLYLNGGSISGNYATTGHGGGVFADDDGSDPYVGGTVFIFGNTEMDGTTSVQSNMYLESDDSNLTQNTSNGFAAGARIGIRLGYNDSDDYFSAEDSHFNASSIEYFVSDDSGYIVRVDIRGSGANAYRLYLTSANSSEAANSKAAIIGASVNATYATTVAPTFKNNVANIPVDPDLYRLMTGGTLSMSDVLHGELALSPYAEFADRAALDVDTNLVDGVDVKVRAADGMTVMTWRVRVVPGNASGTWNTYTVTLNDAAFADENAPAAYYYGDTVSFKPATLANKQFRSWSTVDLLNSDISADSEGVYSFTMPKNNVEVTADFYSVVNRVAVSITGDIAVGAVMPADATYIANLTGQGVGNVSVVWKLGDEVQRGTFGYSKTYTAEITIDLTAEADHLVGNAVTATVNGSTAKSVAADGKTITVTRDFVMPNAKLLEKFTTYTAYSEFVPSTSEGAQDNAYQSAVLNDLNTNHTTVPVVTEDSAINTANIEWINVLNYTNDGIENPYVRVQGKVAADNNPNIVMAEEYYYVMATVYGNAIVADPVITITPNASEAKADVRISCATINATVKYTTDGSDPATSNTARTFSTDRGSTIHTFSIPVEKGSRTNITVKAVAVKELAIDSNIAAATAVSNIVAATATVNAPFGLTVTGDHIESYVITGNDGLYANESAVVTITPAEGYWISAINGNAVTSNSITVTNPAADVTLNVTCLPVITNIPLDDITPEPGKAFPTLNVSGPGYTVSIDSWNTNDSKAAYGATYYPTVRVKATGNYPFAPNFTVTMGSDTVYTSSATTSQQTFTMAVTAPKAKLTAVMALDDITITQGNVLNLPQTVNVTTEGNVISVANINWVCTTEGGFNANKPQTYSFTGTLTLPANVDANGLNTITIEVTVNPLPPLRAPGAKDRLEDVTKTVADDTITVRATVVDLTTDVAGATIYYTVNGASPIDEQGNPIAGAKVYSATSPIVLDTAGSYTIKAVAVKENYTNSTVAEFVYNVTAPRLYTLKVYSWVNGRTVLNKTVTALAGDAISLNTDGSYGYFAVWDPQDSNVSDTTWEGTFTEEQIKANTLTFTMPASDVTVTAVYVARINTVAISGIDAPVAYKALDTSATATVTVPTVNTENVADTVAVSWSASGPAVCGTTYTGTIVLEPSIYYNIAYASNVTVTGLTGATNVKAVVNDEIVTITFDMTAAAAKVTKDFVIGTDGNVLTVENGTSLDVVLSQLPEQLHIPTEAGMIAVDVEWSCDNYAAATEGSYTFTANLSSALAAGGIDPNGKSVSAAVTVKVAAAFVAMPTATPKAATYTTAQTVKLTSATEGAKIYYTMTTDGTLPADPKGRTEFPVDGINVSGTPGETDTVIIRAVAKLGDTYSEVATFRYTIMVPAPTFAVTVANGTLPGGVATANYKAGETVTVTADAAADGKYFVGWSNGTTTVSRNATYTFTMPAETVTLTAVYNDLKVTGVDIRVTAPKAGETLAATVTYDLIYNNGTVAYGLSADALWKNGATAVTSGTKAIRGNAYTLSVSIPCITADSVTVTFNGAAVAGETSGSGVSYSHTFSKLTAAYTSHANPEPITGVIPDTTAFSAIPLPETVSVTTADGTTADIKVSWTVPGGNIGSAATVTITGRLDSAELTAAGITGADNVAVTVYVSSVKKQTVQPPVAMPETATEYLDSVTVTLGSATGGATIYYTTDGSIPTENSTRYTGPIKLTKDTVIKAIAVQTGMNNSTVETFTYKVAATYELTVVNGSGSGKYKAGETVKVIAKDDVDNYFIGWSDGTNTVSTDAEYTFTMGTKAMTLTAKYLPKVKLVNITVPELKVDEALPDKNVISVTPDEVNIESVVWSGQGSVADRLYTAKITISADHGFAQHGDVYVNGVMVPSEMNEDGTVVLTYQALLQNANDSYASHEPVNVEPIRGIPYGTDLATLEGRELPVEATITTTNGNTYTVGIKWNYNGSDYDTGRTDAYTFTLTGEIILPAGITGTNPTISVEISVLAKPYTPPAAPEQPDEPCDGGEDCPHNSFTDLDPNAWYHDAVDYVLEKGLMNGVGNDKFAPGGATSRAMIVTILWRLEGKPAAGGDLFTDTPEGEWYSEAIRWAAANGIVNGYNGTFAPNDAISREQVAAILYRYASYKGLDVSVGEDTNILSFNDAQDVSDWAMDAIQWAVGSGLMQGDGINLMPVSGASRCESAALLMRFIENFARR